MLNRSASLAMSISVLKALPGKLDIKRHSPSILYNPDTETSANKTQCSVNAMNVVCMTIGSMTVFCHQGQSGDCRQMDDKLLPNFIEFWMS